MRSPSAVRSTTARSERPISRWISCVRPLGRPLVTSRGVRVRGRARQHRVLRRHPALAGIAQERRNRCLHAGGAQHLRIAHCDERRAFGRLQIAGGDLYRPQLIRPSTVRTHTSSPHKAEPLSESSREPETRYTARPGFICGGASTSASRPYIYPFVAEAVNSDRNCYAYGRDSGDDRPVYYLALAAARPPAAPGAPPKPDIPDSISPGWKLSSLNKSALPFRRARGRAHPNAGRRIMQDRAPPKHGFAGTKRAQMRSKPCSVRAPKPRPSNFRKDNIWCW